MEFKVCTLPDNPGKIYIITFGTEIALHRTCDGGMARMARAMILQVLELKPVELEDKEVIYGKYEGLENLS